MTQGASVYDAKPWVAHYGQTIAAEPPRPRHRHLAELIREASGRDAKVVVTASAGE